MMTSPIRFGQLKINLPADHRKYEEAHLATLNMEKLIQELNDKGFDIIIDDGSQLENVQPMQGIRVAIETQEKYRGRTRNPYMGYSYKHLSQRPNLSQMLFNRLADLLFAYMGHAAHLTPHVLRDRLERLEEDQQLGLLKRALPVSGGAVDLTK